MIILDTNVVSEAFRPRPSEAVRRWLDAQRSTDLWLCAPVLAELRFGVELLQPGQRRADLDRAITAAERDLFGGRVLSFDRDCAHVFGRIVAARRSLGRTIAAMDAAIAAIALTHRMAVATRDVADFFDLGLELINPFEHHSGVA